MNKGNQTSSRSVPGLGGQSVWSMLYLAWLVALAASLGALFIGEVMGQAPCVLCWHQRP